MGDVSMKIYSLFTAVLFFIFALLQLNDPDPYLWFPIYFLVTSLAIVRLWKPLPKIWILILTGCYLLLAIYFSTLIPYWDMDVEEVRETLGLILAGLFTFGLTVTKGNNSPT